MHCHRGTGAGQAGGTSCWRCSCSTLESMQRRSTAVAGTSFFTGPPARRSPTQCISMSSKGVLHSWGLQWLIRQGCTGRGLPGLAGSHGGSCMLSAAGSYGGSLMLSACHCAVRFDKYCLVWPCQRRTTRATACCMSWRIQLQQQQTARSLSMPSRCWSTCCSWASTPGKRPNGVQPPLANLSAVSGHPVCSKRSPHKSVPLSYAPGTTFCTPCTPISQPPQRRRTAGQRNCADGSPAAQQDLLAEPAAGRGAWATGVGQDSLPRPPSPQGRC